MGKMRDLREQVKATIPGTVNYTGRFPSRKNRLYRSGFI